MRPFLITLLLLLIPFVAPAWAHPGWHVNPHIPELVLYAALGFGVLAWLTMLVYLAVLHVRKKRAMDRLIRARLELAEAKWSREYWTGQRDYWACQRDRAAAELRRLFDTRDYRP